jgi:hypothetical protein
VWRKGKGPKVESEDVVGRSDKALEF